MRWIVLGAVLAWATACGSSRSPDDGGAEPFDAALDSSAAAPCGGRGRPCASDADCEPDHVCSGTPPEAGACWPPDEPIGRRGICGGVAGAVCRDPTDFCADTGSAGFCFSREEVRCLCTHPAWGYDCPE